LGKVFLVTVQVAPEITANRILSPHLEMGPRWVPTPKRL
jgi:hypothetical protein